MLYVETRGAWTDPMNSKLVRKQLNTKCVTNCVVFGVSEQRTTKESMSYGMYAEM